MILNKICKFLGPTLSGKTIVPIVVEIVSLKDDLSCKVEEDILLWGTLICFKVEDDMILRLEPLSIKTLLKLYPSRKAMMKSGGWGPRHSNSMI